MNKAKLYIAVTVLLVIILLIAITIRQQPDRKRQKAKAVAKELLWEAPDTAAIPPTSEGELIRYGRKLIEHTAKYFGPEGRISRKANGMNCQNCHLSAGTRLFGNNFSLVASTYPQFRNRSGHYVSIAQRVNGCMQRSMNGETMGTDSREMKAFEAYLQWVGKDVPKKSKVFGAGVKKLPFMSRAADPAKGKVVFEAQCQVCHGKNGAGQRSSDSAEYRYPPLWGPHSYNTGAGMYRIATFAAYAKNNMPFGTTYEHPQLTDQQAWDVAAFVNSQPRPTKYFAGDWPDISTKPYDYPFGPYADSFSERQHKYGPFTEMAKKSANE